MQDRELLTLTTAILINGTTQVPSQIGEKEIKAVLEAAKRIVAAAAESEGHR